MSSTMQFGCLGPLAGLADISCYHLWVGARCCSIQPEARHSGALYIPGNCMTFALQHQEAASAADLRFPVLLLAK